MSIIKDPALLRLLTKINDLKGFDFSQYKEGTLLRRIGSQLRRRGLSSYDEYIRILEEDPGEIEELIGTMCINVTDFFRNPESFRAIDKIVIPRVILSKREHRHRVIKAWSCGSSAGDEPYSLAMLLLEKLDSAKDMFTITVYGTDIDQGALNDAKRMIYTREKLKAVDNGLLKKYFDKTDHGDFILKREVGNMVKFKHHDVIKDPPLTHCDIILCRNLLIYFNRELQEEILLKFYECLEPGGYLVLGMVESLIGTAINHFEVIDNRLRIYRRPEWIGRDIEESKILSQGEIDKLVGEMLK